MVVGCFRRCNLEDSPRVTCCWCVSSMGSVLRAGPLDGEEYGCVLAVPLPVAAPHFQRICGCSFFPSGVANLWTRIFHPCHCLFGVPAALYCTSRQSAALQSNDRSSAEFPPSAHAIIGTERMDLIHAHEPSGKNESKNFHVQ
ncbi:hypothetical protein VitviT2T_015768 [Vitis vinifera]|uniref:Uncharacterized protein n=1 Tax=Vitis vinifera TaxID=29760 RepID=A0ABY9CNS7_VITVI|nr:hypothetical protein VitviT2T_015768 [Vitis vinifera]